MREYFRLNQYCYLVEGQEYGCIYNLTSGDMIAIDREKTNVLKKCESNALLNQIENIDYDFIENLYNLNLGMYYEKPVYIEKAYIGVHDKMELTMMPNFNIHSLFMEIDTDCNLDCIFCKKNDNTLFRRTGCKRWEIKNDLVNMDMWKSVIDQLAYLKCKQIVFIGGEPLLYFEKIKEIVNYSKQYSINSFIIYTNGTILNDNIISFIKENGIELNIQILASDPEIYNKLSGKQGIKEIINKNIKAYNDNSINYILTIIVNKFNENEVDDIITEYSSFTELEKIKIEYLYPIPKNEYSSKKYEKILYNKKYFLNKVDVNKFCYYDKYHNCYGNQIAITADGNILPCVMSRNIVLGNIVQDSIVSILKNSNFEFYHRLTKKHIKKCNTCSFRYGCFDCRAIEMSASGSIDGLEFCDIVT